MDTKKQTKFPSQEKQNPQQNPNKAPHSQNNEHKAPGQPQKKPGSHW